jgi:hypothetical protein
MSLQFLTSNWIRPLLFSGTTKGVIEKMRIIFFQRGKSSIVPVIPRGGPVAEANAMDLKEGKKKNDLAKTC